MGATLLQLATMERPFIRPTFGILHQPTNISEDAIRSLSDLIRFNAEVNPDHVFALQEERQAGRCTGFTKVTFSMLQDIVVKCVERLANYDLPAAGIQVSVPGRDCGAVALYLESDLTLFVYLCALLWMNIPVCCSPGLSSPSSITHKPA